MAVAAVRLFRTMRSNSITGSPSAARKSLVSRSARIIIEGSRQSRSLSLPAGCDGILGRWRLSRRTMANTLTLEEAAQQLGLTVEQFKVNLKTHKDFKAVRPLMGGTTMHF